MHRNQHRVLLTITAGIATLAAGAAPALAGSDGCSGDDCATENMPSLVLSPTPVPVAPAPVAPQPVPDAGRAREHVAPHAGRSRRTHRIRTATFGIPRGAVAAGAGGTAPAGPDGGLALLAAGALVLVATGGGLVATRRGAGS